MNRSIIGTMSLAGSAADCPFIRGQLDNLHRQRRIGRELRRRGVVLVDVGWDELVGTAAERRRANQQSRHSASSEKRDYATALLRIGGFEESRGLALAPIGICGHA